MKYVFLFCDSAEDRALRSSLPEEEAATIYGAIGKWFEDHAPRILDGMELQPPDTATTVRFTDAHEPLVTDGPFIETNESVGGYAVVEAEDLDDALSVARTWPGRGPVEVRPAVQQE
jgi:hypothetical protein